MILLLDAHMQRLCIIPHFKMMEVGEEGFYQNLMLPQKKPKLHTEIEAIKTAISTGKTDKILGSLRNGIEHRNCSLSLHGLHTS